jgi:hypothetical protein
MDNSEHQQPCPCAWCEVDRQNAEMRAETEGLSARRSAAACSADAVERLLDLAQNWHDRAVDEMAGAVREKNARDGMNFYQHTARAAVLSDCLKHLMEIILPNE